MDGTPKIIDDRTQLSSSNLAINNYQFSIPGSDVEVIDVADVFWQPTSDMKLRNSGWQETTVIEKTDGIK